MPLYDTCKRSVFFVRFCKMASQTDADLISESNFRLIPGISEPVFLIEQKSFQKEQ